MYSVIKKMKPVRDLYRQQLLDQGVPENDLADIDKRNLEELEDQYKKSKTERFDSEEWDSEEWQEIKDPEKYGHIKDTGVPVDVL